MIGVMWGGFGSSEHRRRTTPGHPVEWSRPPARFESVVLDVKSRHSNTPKRYRVVIDRHVGRVTAVFVQKRARHSGGKVVEQELEQGAGQFRRVMRALKAQREQESKNS